MSAASSSAGARPARLRFGAGPRSTESLLLDDLSERLERLGADVLVQPVRLVVPSRALRAHLLARMVRRLGRAVAGVHCTTLFGLARGVVERHLGPPNLHDELVYVFARRFAEREEWLRRSLAHLRNGYRAVDASVRDLLEAGLDPAHVEALEDALATDGPAADASNAEIQRAQALVRVAGRTLGTLNDLGILATPTLLRTATDLIRERPDDRLPTGALFVYGFSDAIGAATDLLTALLDRHSGTIYLDRPSDPAAPTAPDASNDFARRFTERVSDVARPEGRERTALPVHLSCFQSVGGEAEARAVAARIRALLDDGCVPERIGIVARRLESYRTPLRTHLGRLGIPFSAAGAPGPLGPDGRTVRAMVALLERRGSTPVERWLDARTDPFVQITDFDLHLALSTIGAGRLGEVPNRPYAAMARDGKYALPVRRGFWTDEDEAVYAVRRRVPLVALEAAAEAARRLVSLFEEWRTETALGGHADRFRRLLVDELGWGSAADLTRRVTSIVDDLLRGVPRELSIGFDEFVEVLKGPLERVGECPLGGRGGGVRILDVIEARGLTFDHLLVIGLNRGVFPRVVNEDPLLPDSLRAVLSRHGFGVLQDLPQKLSGFDEERYLFSQLLAAAPQVTVSWQDVDEDNHQQTASPLLERLRWSARTDSEAWRVPETARHLYSAATAQLTEPGWQDRPAHEAAVLAGVYGDRGHFGKVLAVALDRSPEPTFQKAPRGLHAVRLRVLDEMDPRRGSAAGERTWSRLGPYYGFVGPARAGDPRTRERLFVTTLEGLASCPWRAFLERLLQLRPIPDPLEALPAVEPLYIGNLVHRVLERVVASQLQSRVVSLEQAREATSRAFWPEPAELGRILTEAAEAVVRDEGFAFPGFARLMAEVVGPYLEVARQTEWHHAAAVPAAATEISESLTVEDRTGRPREVSFRVDRVDGGPALTLTDYKTGRPLSDKKKPEARRKDLLDRIRAGESLQAVAYALAGGEPADTGRYLYLRPDPDIVADQRALEARGSDLELVEAFRQTVLTALEAWDQGTFLPRLIEGRGDKEFRFCATCRVAEACLRGDSGSRGRLREWLGAHGEGPEPAPESDSRHNSALAIWRLRSEAPEDDRRGYRR